MIVRRTFMTTMEPISSLVVDYVTDKIIEAVESAVRTHVIERWSRHRARQFFDSFCKSLRDKGIAEPDLGKMLDDLLDDDARSEIVFDAYRSVCLTKSKTVGPRIIALLTAELVVANAIAGAHEEAIFSAAEELSDGEFDEFLSFTDRCVDEARNGAGKISMLKPDRSLRIQMGEETFDSNWRSKESVSTGPLDLAGEVGTWAAKLKRLGLLSDEVRERHWQYGVDSERYIDEPGTAREITWWLHLGAAAIELSELLRRAKAHDTVSQVGAY